MSNSGDLFVSLCGVSSGCVGTRQEKNLNSRRRSCPFVIVKVPKWRQVRRETFASAVAATCGDRGGNADTIGRGNGGRGGGGGSSLSPFAVASASVSASTCLTTATPSADVSSSLAATETGCLHAVDNIDDDAISLTGEGATEEEEEEGNGNLRRPMEIEDHLMQMEKDLTAKTEEDDGEKRVGEPKKEKKDRRVALLPPPALSSTSKGAPIPRIVIPDGDDDVEQSEQPSSWPSRSGGTIKNGNGESRWKRIVVIEGEKRRHGSRWPLADIILVYEHFRGRRNLSAEGIRVELASNAALRKLMRRRGFLSCYDKIKAMWASSASFFDQEPFN